MSEAHLDLGYTSPDDAVRYRQMRSASRQKPLTSSQVNWRKNQRARDLEEEHAHRKEHPILEPDAETLRTMSDEDKADVIKGIQHARTALDVAKMGVSQEVTVVQPTDAIQEELPFE